LTCDPTDIPYEPYGSGLSGLSGEYTILADLGNAYSIACEGNPSSQCVQRYQDNIEISFASECQDSIVCKQEMFESAVKACGKSNAMCIIDELSYKRLSMLKPDIIQ